MVFPVALCQLTLNTQHDVNHRRKRCDILSFYKQNKSGRKQQQQKKNPTSSTHAVGATVSQLTMTEELRLEPRGVLGRELREELALNSSELRLSEPSPSLRPLLMELLSSQLKRYMDDNQVSSCQANDNHVDVQVGEAAAD